ncbi:MAG TPA: hypothetical protein VL527_06845 [Dongiaceae bacterium]|jgi:hypothetical protein|nr:hypothetical protein [Dongiaceae bacterium]
MKPTASSRAGLLQASLRCFTLGLFGLIPVFGLPAALLALWQYRRVCRRQEEWNPASGYLLAGRICASVGGGVSLLLLSAALVYLLVYDLQGPNWGTN